MLLDENIIKILIADKLYNNGLIDEEMYGKCSKPHISSLPGDLRSTDLDKLNSRVDAINENLKKYKDNNKKLNDDLKSINSDLKKENDTVKGINKRIQSTLVDVDDNFKKFENAFFYENGVRLKKSELKSKFEDAGIEGYFKDFYDNYTTFKKSYKGFSKEIRGYLKDGFIRQERNLTIRLRDLFDDAYYLHSVLGDCEERQSQSNAFIFQNSSNPIYNNFDLLDSLYDDGRAPAIRAGVKSERNIRKLEERKSKVEEDIDLNSKIISDFNDELKNTKSKINEVK